MTIEQTVDKRAQWDRWEADLADPSKILSTVEEILGRRVGAQEFFTNPTLGALTLPGLPNDRKLAFLLMEAATEQLQAAYTSVNPIAS